MDSLQYDLFGGTPPHVRDSTTSQEAAESIAPKVGKLQKEILAVVRTAKDGLTRDEIEVITGLPHTTSSARVRELFIKGLLETRIDQLLLIKINWAFYYRSFLVIIGYQYIIN